MQVANANNLKLLSRLNVQSRSENGFIIIFNCPVRTLKFERLMEIRKKYEQFIEADRRRKERNELIIDKLHNIKNNWLSMRCKYPSIRESDSQINYSGKTRVDLLAELGKSQNRTQALLEPVTNFGERGFQNLILTELSKHYILIPKQKHANFDPAQNVNNEESYLVPSKQTLEDWKSKYDVLKNLENNELKKDYKQTSGTRTENIVDNDIDITYSDPNVKNEISIGNKIEINEHMSNLDNSVQSTRITTAKIFDNVKSDHHRNDVTKLEFFPESQFHRENAMREISNSVDYNENNNYNDRRLSGNKKMEYYAASQVQQNIMPRMKSHDDDIHKDEENKDGNDIVLPPFRIESMQHYVNSAQKLPQYFEIPHEQQNSLHQPYNVQPHQYYLPPLPHNNSPEQHGGSGAQEQNFSSARMPSITNFQLDVHNISSQQMYPPEKPNSISHSYTEHGQCNEAENIEQQNIKSLCYEDDSSYIEVNEKEFVNSTEDTEVSAHINADKNRILHTHNEVISDESIVYVNTMGEVLLNTNIKSDSDKKPSPISNDEKDVKINIDHKNDDNTETKQFTDEEPEKEHPSKQSEEKFNPQNESTSDFNQNIIHPVNYIVGQDNLSVQEYSHELQNYENVEADLDQDLNQTYDANYHEQYAPTCMNQQYEENNFEQNQYVTNQSELQQNGQNQDNQNQYEQNQVGQYQYEQNQVEQSQYELSQSEPDKTAQNQEGQYQYEQNREEQYQYEQTQFEQNQDEQYQYQNNAQDQNVQNQYEQNQTEHYQYDEHKIAQYQYEQSQNEQYQSEQIQLAQNQEEQIQLAQNQEEQPQYEQNQYEQTQQHNFDPTIEGGLYEELHEAYTAQMNSDSTIEDKLYEELHGAYTAQMNFTPQDQHDRQIINQPHNKALLEKAGFETEAHGDNAKKQLEYQKQGGYVKQQDTYKQSAHELRPDEDPATITPSPQKDEGF